MRIQDIITLIVALVICLGVARFWRYIASNKYTQLLVGVIVVYLIWTLFISPEQRTIFITTITNYITTVQDKVQEVFN